MPLTLGVAPVSWLSRASRGSCCHQNALSEQVKAGAAVALPFQQLEPVDLPFGLAAAQGRVRAVRTAAPSCSSHRTAMPLTTASNSSSTSQPLPEQKCWFRAVWRGRPNGSWPNAAARSAPLSGPPRRSGSRGAWSSWPTTWSAAPARPTGSRAAAGQWRSPATPPCRTRWSWGGPSCRP